jgi:Coenzyme PQQ synthesis protein D (PqqD)
MMFALRNGVSVAETDDGIALLDEDSGEYFTLNPTGALVLRSLLGGATPAQTAEQITTEYAVDGDSARFDVQELVSALQTANLLAPETTT